MKNVLFGLCAVVMSASVVAGPTVINITSPINYQTVFSKTGQVKVTYRVNATTLFQLPKNVYLLINGIPQKKVKYGQSNNFTVNGVPDGKYKVRIAIDGHNGKMLNQSEEIIFFMKKQGYKKLDEA